MKNTVDDELIKAVQYAVNMMSPKMSKVTVFYAGRIYAEYLHLKAYREAITSESDVYQGGYLYLHDNKYGKWFRCDVTPVLDEDVPPELKMWLLILD